MENEALRQFETSGLSKRSLTPSESMLSIELSLSAQNSKTEITKELQKEFLRVFGEIEPDCLQWAFREWRMQSPYLPTVHEVDELVRRYRQAQLEEKAAEEEREEKRKLAAARERGELVDLGQILRQLNEIARMPEPPHLRRLRLARAQERPAVTPPIAIALTPEQIAARRPAERAEIERYEQAAR